MVPSETTWNDSGTSYNAPEASLSSPPPQINWDPMKVPCNLPLFPPDRRCHSYQHHYLFLCTILVPRLVLNSFLSFYAGYIQKMQKLKVHKNSLHKKGLSPLKNSWKIIEKCQGKNPGVILNKPLEEIPNFRKNSWRNSVGQFLLESHFYGISEYLHELLKEPLKEFPEEFLEKFLKKKLQEKLLRNFTRNAWGSTYVNFWNNSFTNFWRNFGRDCCYNWRNSWRDPCTSSHIYIYFLFLISR